jgi:hypothetical protein|tara:strand:+ start:965 stop:1168 length:204 start_codon:yes stop_codon:yes gene_type:complete
MRTFFGLTNDYIEGVYEEIFNLKMHGNWSFMEAYNLPIKIRRWFLKRLVKYFQEKSDNEKKSSRRTL